MKVTVMQPGIFRGIFLEYGHMSNENLTHRCTQTGKFFPKLGYFLPASKKGRADLPLLLLVACLS